MHSPFMVTFFTLKEADRTRPGIDATEPAFTPIVLGTLYCPGPGVMYCKIALWGKKQYEDKYCKISRGKPLYLMYEKLYHQSSYSHQSYQTK